MNSAQNDWADFPQENTVYRLDVVFKKEESQDLNDQYTIVHYAAYFKDGCWVDANTFDHITTQGAFQISYALWYKV